MLEVEHPDRMARISGLFFDSKEAASKFLEERKKISTSNEESKKDFEEPEPGSNIEDSQEGA